MRITTTLSISFICGVLCATVTAQVRPRITRPVDDARFVRVPATTYSLATAARDAGHAPGDLRMDRMLLQLKSTPQQDAALEQLLAEQQDPQSANYLRWLTPEEFGERFGVAQEDLDAVTRWLEGHGFRVNEIARGRRSIEFSGTARQVESAFHTEIHHYMVAGVRHVANAADVAIPEALAGVVGGVASLHDFHARPLHHMLGQPAGQTNLNGGAHGLSPYDFATIYNVAPLWTQGFDGAGQTIAIVADTNVKLTDVTAFRSQFGLGANNVTVVLNGANPGVVSGEETEANLDIQWSGAVAKGAAVKLVVSANTNASDGVTLSAQYIVNNNLAPVMSMSYGLCEAYMGTENALYNSLWAQAAAQGISVFVSAGDSGSAGCDAPASSGSKGQNTTTPAARGFGINGLASTPYNVAVGGTQFSDSTGSYWNTGNDAHLASAKGYIPEAVWNESGYTTAGAAANGLWAGSGGFSTLYATPAWQTGAGVPTVDPVGTGHHRYIPDVSLSGAGHDGYLVQIEGGLYLVGGTSAGAPALAGIMAILVQRAGSRQGNPNPRFYAIAAQSPAAYHDIVAGSNAVPCQGGSANCSSRTAGVVGTLNGFAAAPGYDLATGLGAVDANALAIAWSSTPAGVSIMSLSPNPMAGSTANQTLAINGSGFAAGATVNLTYAGGAVVHPAIASVTSTQILATVNVGTTARTWTVQVANSATSSSNTVNLTVTAPASGPAITSLSPNPMTGSTSNQTLTINGSGFVAGATVNLAYSGGTVVHPTVASTSSTQIAATVNVGTTARTWTVQVVNPGGATSSAANLTVTAPAAPAISSLSPNPMTGSTANQTLTINGAGFQAGLTVVLAAGTTTTTYQSSAISSVTATRVQLGVNVGTAARSWTVQVVNPGGVASNAATLAVTGSAPPAITSLNPNTMTGSSANQTLTINGSGFQAGARVSLNAGNTTYTYTGSYITSVTATQLQVRVNVGTTPHTWTVQAVNPDNSASNAATLTVTAPAQAPAIASLGPSPMTGSASAQTLTINGTGFQSGIIVGVQASGASTVTVYSGAQVTVTPTQLKIQVNVGTSKRPWYLQLMNPDGQYSNVGSWQVN
jgi:hypothetical protein